MGSSFDLLGQSAIITVLVGIPTSQNMIWCQRSLEKINRYCCLKPYSLLEHVMNFIPKRSGVTNCR